MLLNLKNTKFIEIGQISTISYCIIKLGILKEGDQMNPHKFLCNSKGFTLVEVMLSITILGIIAISMFTFFTQAYSYTKINEDKTLGTYVARNTLVYMERQNFNKVYEHYFSSSNGETIDSPIQLRQENCFDIHVSGEIVFDQFCSEMFSQTFNNVPFTVNVEIQPHSDLSKKNYLIPTKVIVNWGESNTTFIEGYITHESIR